MRTDRELLLAAAAAAGVQLHEQPNIVSAEGKFLGLKAVNPQPRNSGERHRLWNPLFNDGEALRLAVTLNMELLRSTVNDPRPWVSAVIRNTTVHGAEDIGSDPHAATRRAIVRAAAEIGEAMP